MIANPPILPPPMSVIERRRLSVAVVSALGDDEAGVNILIAITTTPLLLGLVPVRGFPWTPLLHALLATISWQAAPRFSTSGWSVRSTQGCGAPRDDRRRRPHRTDPRLMFGTSFAGGPCIPVVAGGGLAFLLSLHVTDYCSCTRHSANHANVHAGWALPGAVRR